MQSYYEKKGVVFRTGFSKVVDFVPFWAILAGRVAKSSKKVQDGAIFSYCAINTFKLCFKNTSLHSKLLFENILIKK